MNIFPCLVTTLFLCSVGTQLLKTFFKALVTGTFNRKTLTSDGDFPSSHSSLVSSMTVLAWANVINLNSKDIAIINLSIIVAGAVTVHALTTLRDALGVRHTVEILCIFSRMFLSWNKKNVEELESKIPDFDKSVSDGIQNNFEDIAKPLNIKSGHLPHEVVGGIFWGILISITTSSYYYGFYQYFIIGIISILAYIVIMSVFLKYGLSFINKIIKNEVNI